jgi:hypothetical protein
MFEHVINGKRVIFKDRLPASEGWDLWSCIVDFDRGGVREAIKLARPILPHVIATWEFAGDPADPAAYDDLDVIEELLPLANALGEWCSLKAGRLVGKNSPRPSTPESALSSPSPGDTGE